MTYNNGKTTTNVEDVLEFGTEIEQTYLREKQNNTQQQQRFDQGMNWKQILDGSKNLLLSNINKPLVQTRHCSDETSREKIKTNPVTKNVNKFDDRIRPSRLSLRRKTR